MKASLAVLITCYNRKEHTLSCLEAFYESAKKKNNVDLNIYLVDDGSTDGTTLEVTSTYPEVKVLQGNGELYWGGGMNKAWKEAALGDYDFYMWLNDDTYLKPYAIKELMNDSDSFMNQAIIAGVCELQDGSAISYSGYMLKDKIALKPVGKPMLCDYFNGNVVLVPKHVFSKLGFIDPFFQHYLGDIDYGMRARSLDINSYISSNIIGKCDGFMTLPVWCNPKHPLKVRIKHFNSPLTKGPKQVFIFEKRHTSLMMAIFRSSIIYIRLFFPTLWIIMGKQKLGQA